jgi:hypothetical protein
MKHFILFLLSSFFFFGSTSFAGEADVIKVNIDKTSDNSYRFSVTILHKDTGWSHYANKWDIIDEKGTVIGTRVLHHPHVDEQPFTRNLSGVKIPDYVKTVTIRAHDLVHKYGGKHISIELPQ